jgi:signal peptidase II
MVGNKAWFFIVAAVTLILDQITKYAIVRSLELYQIIPIIPGIFNISRVHNYGAAFGILQQYTTLLIIVSLLIIVLLLYSYFDLVKTGWSTLFGGLIVGGALGNLLDRIAYGYVVDFIDFIVWPSFNVADSAITVGGIGLFVVYLTTKKLK